MDIENETYPAELYIQTSSGNKVARSSVLCGSQNIVLNGKSVVQDNCIIRGDLASVRIGRHCVIRKGAVIRPPFKKFSRGSAFFPCMIGDHVWIGEGSIVNAAQIGSFVHIGKDCVIGKRCCLKESCMIEDGAVVPPDTVVPSFHIFGGRPAKSVAMLPESTEYLMTEATKQFYKRFTHK